MLEKLVDKYIRDKTLKDHPLYSEQHAFTASCSVGSVLHKTVAKIEVEFLEENRGHTVGIFLNFEGVFLNMSY